MTVTVTDNQQGELVAVISGGSTTGKDLNFTNGYKAAPAEVHFSGLKTLEGRALADKEFSFTLTGADDGISETVKNDADGKISFTKITYTKAAVHPQLRDKRTLRRRDDLGHERADILVQLAIKRIAGQILKAQQGIAGRDAEPRGGMAVLHVCDDRTDRIDLVDRHLRPGRDRVGV